VSTATLGELALPINHHQVPRSLALLRHLWFGSSPMCARLESCGVENVRWVLYERSTVKSIWL
jgi:hypothetical protein